MEQPNFSLFTGRTTSGSELYAVYQPLLGWRGRRTMNRLVPGVSSLQTGLFGRISSGLRPNATVEGADHLITDVRVAQSPTATALERRWDSLLLDEIAYGIRIDLEGNPNATPEQRAALLANRMEIALESVRGHPKTVEKRALALLLSLQLRVGELAPPGVTPEELDDLARLLGERESMVAGVVSELLRVNGADQHELLGLLTAPGPALTVIKKDADPIEVIDPATDLDRLVLSPVGIMQLSRQYFFELDSFLGPAVQHVWLAPGSSLELMEVSSRRVLTERSTESSFESSRQTTSEAEQETEFATVVKAENQRSTKFGVSLDSDSKFTVGVYTGQVKTSTKYDADNALKTSREETHKQRRKESTKVVQDLKQTLKTTFRTVTETTDTSSRRYVFQNKSDDALQNYELRRKMRRVGVQLQDLGQHLCWQTYVDGPGDQLGLSNLVHIAEPPDYGAVPHPDAPPVLAPEIKDSPISFSMYWPGDDVTRGKGTKWVTLTPATELIAPQPGYIYSRHEVKVVSADQQWAIEARAAKTIMIPAGAAASEESVQALQVGVATGPGGITTSDANHITGELTVFWKPSQALVAQTEDAATKAADQLTADRKRQAELAYFTEARDRIKAAASVRSRPFEELREEERIIVYRNLIRQLLREARIPSDNHALRHAVSELLESMFDMDRMLYFVAPEWWSPRPLPAGGPAPSPQDLGADDDHATALGRSATTSWSGIRASRADNYYITEDSAPARLGASLGWILQLDGDNLRNAFLNAPWVKAVVPIREGRSIAALNWLTRNNVEGSEGLDDLYIGSDEERQKIVANLRAHEWEDATFAKRVQGLEASGVTIRDALMSLAASVADGQAAARTAAHDKELDRSYLPQDRVFERGFEHNQGGFSAEAPPFSVYSEWIEVVPTDQIVPVAVSYDPKSGQML